jgi:hypothetical protein
MERKAPASTPRTPPGQSTGQPTGPASGPLSGPSSEPAAKTVSRRRKLPRVPHDTATLALQTASHTAAVRLTASRRVGFHGIVANERGGPVLVTYGLAIALCCLWALGWPLRAGAVLVAVIGSGLLDLDGGRGWLRYLTPRDSGRALVLWRNGSEPTGATPDRGADGPIVAADHARGGDAVPLTALIAVPSEATRVRAPTLLAPVLAACALLGVAGAFLRPLFPDPAGPLLVGVALLAFFTAALAALWDRRGRADLDPESGIRLAERVLNHLEQDPSPARPVAVAVVGGGTLFNDGIEVLLRNHDHIFSPATTQVIAWQPEKGALQAVRVEGRIKGRPADPGLVEIADQIGLLNTKATTAAGRAARAGWSGIGLVGGLDDPGSVVRGLAMLAGADRGARGEE